MPHKLGQVFLHDKNILRKISALAEGNPEQTLLEIGCGDGILTMALNDLCQKLYVIEIDEKCIDSTTQTFFDQELSLEKVTFIHEDVLKTGFSKIKEDEVSVIANIPYYISAKIIKLLCQEKDSIKKAVLMVQDEFAKKSIAKPGSKDYTSLTVYTRFHFDVDYEFKVSQNCFYPVPKVDSAVITLTPKPKPPFEVNDEQFFNMVRSAFWGRRKPFVSCLAKGPYLKIDPAFKKESFFIDRKLVRGETLGLDEFYDWYQAVSPFIAPS